MTMMMIIMMMKQPTFVSYRRISYLAAYFHSSRFRIELYCLLCQCRSVSRDLPITGCESTAQSDGRTQLLHLKDTTSLYISRTSRHSLT